MTALPAPRAEQDHEQQNAEEPQDDLHGEDHGGLAGQRIGLVAGDGDAQKPVRAGDLLEGQQIVAAVGTPVGDRPGAGGIEGTDFACQGRLDPCSLARMT